MKKRKFTRRILSEEELNKIEHEDHFGTTLDGEILHEGRKYNDPFSQDPFALKENLLEKAEKKLTGRYSNILLTRIFYFEKHYE